MIVKEVPIKVNDIVIGTAKIAPSGITVDITAEVNEELLEACGITDDRNEEAGNNIVRTPEAIQLANEELKRISMYDVESRHLHLQYRDMVLDGLRY